MRLLYVVLDGAADGFDVGRSSLALSRKPFIDSLAGSGVCGLVYTVGRGVAPESDVAVLSLLGYDPSRYYTGRGPLEALGAGIDFVDGWLAVRANFATVKPGSKRIIDRRAGRSLTSAEARELAEALDGMKLDNGDAVARFKATIGHRAVLVIRHSKMRLSAEITNTDPAYERIGLISHARQKYEPYIQTAKPLRDTPEARKAAELVNEFTEKAIRILDKHPVNEQRRRKGLLPANAVLLRDAGDRPPQTEPFQEKYGFTMASIVEMIVERGIARALQLHDIQVKVEGRTKKEILIEEAEKAAKALEKYAGIYVHLKGPDEPGHDGDLQGKIKAIEEIDKYFFGTILDHIDRNNTVIIITSDHATPWYMKSHSSDPVPLLVSHPSFKGPGKFHEQACRENLELGILEGGYKILPTVIQLVREKLGSQIK